jgi:hypothetical protein
VEPLPPEAIDAPPLYLIPEPDPTAAKTKVTSRTMMVVVAFILGLTLLGAAAYILITMNMEKPLDIDELIGRAEALMLEENYEAALELYLQAITDIPEDARGYLGAAEAYTKMERLRDAADILKRGLDKGIDDEKLSAEYKKIQEWLAPPTSPPTEPPPGFQVVTIAVSSAPAALTDEEKYATVFESVRTKFRTEGTYYMQGVAVMSDIFYTFYDIDENGTKELIFATREGGVDIYTMPGARPVQLLNKPGGQNTLVGINELGYIVCLEIEGSSVSFVFSKITGVEPYDSLETVTITAKSNSSRAGDVEYWITDKDGERQVTASDYTDRIGSMEAPYLDFEGLLPLTVNSGKGNHNPHPFVAALHEFMLTGNYISAVLADLDGDGDDEVFAIAGAETPDDAHTVSFDGRIAVFAVDSGATTAQVSMEALHLIGRSSYISYIMYISDKGYIICQEYQSEDASRYLVYRYIGDVLMLNDTLVDGTEEFDERSEGYGIGNVAKFLMGGYPPGSEAPKGTPVDQTPGILAMTSGASAVTSVATVMLDGELRQFDAYNIDNEYFFKLRDLAYILDGTDYGFEVGYDSGTKTILLESGRPYTPNGTEMKQGDGLPKGVKPSENGISVDGTPQDVPVYTIGSNTIISINDLTDMFVIGLDWNPASRTFDLILDDKPVG